MKAHSLFCSGKVAAKLAELKDIGQLANVVCFDKISTKTREAINSKRIVCYDFYEKLLGQVNMNIADYPHIKPSSCMAVVCTLGATGNPKFIMLSQLNLISCLTVIRTIPDVNVQATDVYLSYVPICYIIEKISIYSLLSVGGNVW